MVQVQFEPDLRYFREYLNPKVIQRSVNRATRVAARKATVQGSRALRKRFVVKAGDVSKSMQMKPVTAGSAIEQHIVYRGSRLGLHRFGAKPKRVTLKGRKSRRGGRKRVGVTVRIRADSPRKLVKGGFMVASRGGKPLVYRRVGRSRLPVRVLKTISIPEMMGLQPVGDVLLKTARESFSPEFERLMDYELEKLIKR